MSCGIQIQEERKEQPLAKENLDINQDYNRFRIQAT